MAKQAKTLTQVELRRVLDYVATRKHAARNRALVCTSFYAGLRACEMAALLVGDVVDERNKVRSEFVLAAEQTKGSKAGTVFVSEKLRKELQAYVDATPGRAATEKLFYTQKQESDGFSANTLTQFFHHLYKHVGIAGASGHSGRRTFITNGAAKGVSARVLMELARHANLATTQRYIDVNPEMLRKAVEMI